MNDNRINLILAKIQFFRKENLLTLENMAEELSLTHSAYRKVENGLTKLTVERLLDIVDVLGIDISTLFEGIVTTNTESDEHEGTASNLLNDTAFDLLDELELIRMELRGLRNRLPVNVNT